MENCNDEKTCGGRREFLVKASALAGGVVLSLSGLKTTQGQKKSDDAPSDDLVLKLDSASPLSKVGGSQVVETKSGKVIIVRNGEMSFAAFSAKCTHKGATVKYDEKTKQIYCPSHNSQFEAATGKVLKGPANQPLPAFTTDNAIVVSLKAKS